MWAGALGASALFFASLTSSALAQDEPALDEDATAIYFARVIDMEHLGGVTCPPEYICMDAVFDLTLEPIETIANSPDIGTQTFRVAQHTYYRDGIILVVVAQRDLTGKWHLIDRTVMRRQACFADPEGDVWDNFDDPENEWYAEHDKDEAETCIFGRDRFKP